MNKINSIEAIDRTDLSEQTKYRFDEISKIENYFHEEINQERLSKYVAAFDYIDKALIVLSATSAGVSIISFTSIVLTSASLTLFFSLTTGIVKKLLNITRKKKKKHDKILCKLHSIEILISQALIDMDISHEEFVTILKEKDKDEKMKDNLRSENKEFKVMRLSSTKSKK